jgi:hypothetical protein
VSLINNGEQVTGVGIKIRFVNICKTAKNAKCIYMKLKNR